MIPEYIQSAAAKFEADLAKPAKSAGPPALIILTGLPGAGKSYLARELAAQLPCLVLETDFVRKALRPKPNYTPWESGYVHRTTQLVMASLLRQGWNVVYDATNLRHESRRRLAKLAQQAGARWLVVRVTAPKRVIRSRLSRRGRNRSAGDFSDADWSVYEQLAETAEPVRTPHVLVDARGDVSRGVEAILAALGGDESVLTPPAQPPR